MLFDLSNYSVQQCGFFIANSNIFKIYSVKIYWFSRWASREKKIFLSLSFLWCQECHPSDAAAATKSNVIYFVRTRWWHWCSFFFRMLTRTAMHIVRIRLLSYICARVLQVVFPFAFKFECASTNAALMSENGRVLFSLMLPKTVIGFEWLRYWTIITDQRMAALIVRFQRMLIVEFHFAFTASHRSTGPWITFHRGGLYMFPFGASFDWTLSGLKVTKFAFKNAWTNWINPNLTTIRGRFTALERHHASLSLVNCKPIEQANDFDSDKLYFVIEIKTDLSAIRFTGKCEKFCVSYD